LRPPLIFVIGPSDFCKAFLGCHIFFGEAFLHLHDHRKIGAELLQISLVIDFSFAVGIIGFGKRVGYKKSKRFPSEPKMSLALFAVRFLMTGTISA
jgi:hypothetical protein